jgi:MFS family permease
MSLTAEAALPAVPQSARVKSLFSQESNPATANGTAVPVLEPFDGVAQASQHAAEAENQYPTGAKFYSILLSLGFLLFFAGLDASIVATAVPAITNHFHTIADVGWYSVAFRLPLCSFQFLFGKLYKRFPVKSMLLVTQGIFLLGSLLCATAVSSKMFVFGRAVTGLAAAGMSTGAFTMLTRSVPLRKRPMYMGIFGGLETVAVVLAPVLGGILTQRLSWRW